MRVLRTSGARPGRRSPAGYPARVGTILAPPRAPETSRRAGGRASRLLWPVLAALLILAGVAARVLVGGTAALPQALQDGLTLATSVFIESLPFVVLGIALSVIVQIWLPDRLIERLMPSRPWARRMVLSLLGVLLPVCECGNVPLARGLVSRGMSPAESVTFLLAAPILNPITIITTYQAFGWSDGILVARVVGGFVIANLVGWVFSRLPDEQVMLTPAFAESCRVHAHEDGGARRWRRSVARFAEETSTLLPALILGSAIAGAIQVGIPRDVLLALGSNPLWSVLALMALAFVVSICSNVDAFFILAFGSAFLPGGVAAFLTFGAMVDVKMVALMRTTYRTAAVVQLAAMVGLASLVLGLAVNVLA